MVGGLQCRGEYPLGIFSRRTCHQSRSQRPDLQCPFRICRIRPRQSVATPEARKRPVRGEPHGKLLSFGPDIPSAQLNQLPLGTDQRSSGLLLVGTTRTTPAKHCSNSSNSRQSEKIFSNSAHFSLSLTSPKILRLLHTSGARIRLRIATYAIALIKNCFCTRLFVSLVVLKFIPL